MTVLVLSHFGNQKKIEHSDRGIEFTESIKWNDLDKIKESIGLKRTLSNIINNAVEAVEPGNGIGLLNAQKYIDSVGGTLRIKGLTKNTTIKCIVRS